MADSKKPGYFPYKKLRERQKEKMSKRIRRGEKEAKRKREIERERE